MPRKITLETMIAKLEKIEKKREQHQAEMNSIDEEYQKLYEIVVAEKNRIRTDRLVKIGEVVCKYFGEDITDSEFEEAVKSLMLISEAKDFITSEKVKREQDSSESCSR